MDPLDGKLLVTYEEAERITGYSHAYLYEAGQRGSLVVVGARNARRITAASLRAFIENLISEAAKPRLARQRSSRCTGKSARKENTVVTTHPTRREAGAV